MLLNEKLKLAIFEMLLGARRRMLEAIFPGSGVVRQGYVVMRQAMAALPLVLRDVDRDAIKISADKGLVAEAGQCAEEAQEDVLRQIVDVLLAPDEPRECAEDHRLMLLNNLLECGCAGQGGWMD